MIKITEEEKVKSVVDYYESSGNISTSGYRNWNGGVHYNTILNTFGSWGNAIDEAGIPHDFVECPGCGDLYDKIGNHWYSNDDCRPEVSERQHEIITGSLMGDGSRDGGIEESHNGSLVITNTKRKFLEWVESELGILSSGIHLKTTAEESAENARKSGSDPNASGDDYSDCFYIQTRTHPDFTRYNEWYSTGKKRFPKDLKLTPLILKVWFVCDGSYISQGVKSPYVHIGVSNEGDRENYLKGLIAGIGLSSEVYSGTHLRIPTSDTDSFFEYIGDPIDGFEYKWPN